MSTKKSCFALGAAAALTAMSFGLIQAVAQTSPGQQPDRQPDRQPSAQTGQPDSQRGEQSEGRSLTLSGRLVDLHCYMTKSKSSTATGMPGTTAGQPDTTGANRQPTPGAPTDPKAEAQRDQPAAQSGDKPMSQSSDNAPLTASECAQCIRNGAPCALESNMGLVILGKGAAGGPAELAGYAGQQITVRGQLFEKGGVKYFEFDTIERQVAQGASNPGRTPPK
jgi:hypothetical protein